MVVGSILIFYIRVQYVYILTSRCEFCQCVSSWFIWSQIYKGSRNVKKMRCFIKWQIYSLHVNPFYEHWNMEIQLRQCSNQHKRKIFLFNATEIFYQRLSSFEEPKIFYHVHYLNLNRIFELAECTYKNVIFKMSGALAFRKLFINLIKLW